MEVVRATSALILFALAGVSHAQQMPLDGSRPPVISVAEASRSSAAEGGLSAAAASQIIGPSSGDVPPSTSIGGNGVVGDVLNLPPPPKPRAIEKAPPAFLQVEPGKNYKFGMAIGHINRIVTPFAKPTLRTTSTASTSIEGSIIYVASQSEDPIGMFIFDESSPAQAVSLTLVPGVMAPISTTIAVSGWTGESGVGHRSGNQQEALAFEGKHPYLETLTVMLKDIAQGHVPDGYGYEQVRNGYVPGGPNCDIPGVHVLPMQVIQGSSFKAIVAKATNTSLSSAEIREDLCKGADLRAVAAWPYTTLSPGQSTELYLVVGAQTVDYDSAARPSLIEGGN